MSSAGIDLVLAAQKRLNDVRQQTNDKDQIKKAEDALAAAKAQAAAARAARSARGS